MPFPELHGEFTEYVGRAEDAIIATSNYRLHIKFKESVVNVSIFLNVTDKLQGQIRFENVSHTAQNNRIHKNDLHCLHWRLCESVH